MRLAAGPLCASLAILGAPDPRGQFAQGGTEVGGMSAAVFVALVQREAATYKTIVQKANIKPE